MDTTNKSGVLIQIQPRNNDAGANSKMPSSAERQLLIEVRIIGRRPASIRMNGHIQVEEPHARSRRTVAILSQWQPKLLRSPVNTRNPVSQPRRPIPMDENRLTNLAT